MPKTSIPRIPHENKTVRARLGSDGSRNLYSYTVKTEDHARRLYGDRGINRAKDLAGFWGASNLRVDSSYDIEAPNKIRRKVKKLDREITGDANRKAWVSEMQKGISKAAERRATKK